MATGKIEVLCDEYGGHPLGAPNDLCFDNAGRIYFTSRLPNADLEKGNVNSVYRIDLNGKTTRVVHSPDIHMPNGLVTAPDDKTLYLVESDGRAGRNRCILAFDLDEQGNLSKQRKLIDFHPGRSGDGMAIDERGNLYIAAGLHKPRGTAETLDTRPGIHVVSPAGELLAFVETPEDTITNCRFGGEDLKTLYITCGSLLMSLPTQIAGKSLYRPDK
jgi:gluconolactonase